MNRFRKALATKRRKAAVIVALLALIPMGVFAYFASHPNANSFNNTPVQLGSAPAAELVTVAIGPADGLGPQSGNLTPGMGIVIPMELSVASNDTYPVNIAAITVTITQDGSGNIFDDNTNAYISGCKASWFSGVTSITAPLTINPGSHVTGGLNVDMSSPTGVDQSVCEGAAPDVVVTVS
jgi:hypothetical protein